MRARLVLLVASCLVGALLIEVGLRANAYYQDRKLYRRALAKTMPIPADRIVNLGHLVELSDLPGVIYRLRANLPPVLYSGATVTTNSAGFRDREYTIAKPANVTRILGIGDSVMFGEGVADGEEFLSLLEVELNARSPGQRWEVINTAVPGYNTAMEVATLEALGLAYEPDIVVVCFVANDTDLPFFVRDERDVLDLEYSLLLRALPGWPQPRSVATIPRTGLSFAPDRSYGGFAGGQVDVQRIPAAYRHMLGPEAVLRAIERLLEMGVQHGFRTVFFSQPRPRPETEAILAGVRAKGLEPVDFGRELVAYMRGQGIREYSGSELTLSADDAHPSVLQHRLAAESLFAALKARGLIKAESSRRR